MSARPHLSAVYPVCPPALIEELYVLRADTQVRPYTNHTNTTNHSRGSEGKAPNDPRMLDGARSIDPLRVGLNESTALVRPPAMGGRPPPLYSPMSPSRLELCSFDWGL